MVWSLAIFSTRNLLLIPLFGYIKYIFIWDILVLFNIYKDIFLKILLMLSKIIWNIKIDIGFLFINFEFIKYLYYKYTIKLNDQYLRLNHNKFIYFTYFYIMIYKIKVL